MRGPLTLLFVCAAPYTCVATACSKSEPEPGKAVKIGDVCNEPDQSRVRLQGFLRYRRDMLSFCSSIRGRETCDLELYESSERPPEFDIMRPRVGTAPVTAKLSVVVGDDPSEMNSLPKKFQASDIAVHLKSGANATDGSQITIDGTLSVIPPDPAQPNAAKSCFVNVEWVSAGHQ